jgi:F-type H+-transporting ATPase subunit delta
MPNPRLAGRYAKSLLDLAVEKNEAEPVYQDVVLMNTLIRSSPEFERVLKSPVIKGDKKEKIIGALTRDKLGIILSSFIRLLVKKGREFYLPEIITSFIKQYKDHKGIHIVLLTTAVPLTEDIKSVIVHKISESAHLKEVELNTKVNPDIIGGFIIEVDGQLIDASILYDLNAIKKQFESNDFIYKIR